MRSETSSRVNIGAIERARVHPGGHAVKLLPHVLRLIRVCETPRVRPGEGVAGSSSGAVEAVFGDVDVETPLKKNLKKRKKRC